MECQRQGRGYGWRQKCVYTNEECLTLYKMRYFSAGICGPNSLFYKLDEQLI